MAFKTSNILFKEKPFACVVKQDFVKSTCASCFKQNIKLLKCVQCERNHYCNRDCQKRDWKQHKLECKCLAKKIKIFPSDISLLTLRIICKYKDGCSNDTDYLIINKFGSNPRCFDDLMSNKFEETSRISEDFDKTVLELQNILNCISIDFDDFISRDIAMTIFQKSVTNNFEIQDGTNVTIGFGCYLNGSGLDHSCWPNTAYSFVGNQFVLRAIRDIELEEKLCINYTDTLQLRDDRRRHLQEQYQFECVCEACMDDELDREMSQLYCEYGDCKGSVLRVLGTSKFQCDKCSVVVDEGVMAMKHSIFRAKLYRINQLMLEKEYDEAYEVARRELDYFHLECQPTNGGGLIQLCMAEKAFESAIFLGDYEGALDIIRMKKSKGSWIHERLVRFLGHECHPIAMRHLDKFQRILGIV